MVDTLLRGGFMMVPILLGSILALTIVIERLWALQKSRIVPVDFIKRMQDMLGQGKHSEAISACRENDTHMARVLAAGLEQQSRPRAEIVEALELAGRKESSSLSRWVGALGAIAALEPLMGLLGTVLGLIESFQEVEKLKVVGNPSVVASGVWQALITTAAGLIIAIPTYAMYRYFRSRVGFMMMEMESYAFDLVQKLTSPAQKSEGGDKA